jgi:3D (Asp-Asp-Asp) domain-containing protein
MTKTRWANGRYPCAVTATTRHPSHKAGPQAWLTPKLRARVALEVVALLVATAGAVYTAMLAKTAGHVPALAAVESDAASKPMIPSGLTPAAYEARADEVEFEFIPADPVEPAPAADAPGATTGTPAAVPGNLRWFNGRPVRPAGTLRMRVTAYSPDAKSCGDSADGITATLHSVETNGFHLVAADPRVLRYGSLITVPGYAESAVVPVLDCGGKIKGNRLDVLYPTHEEARRWGSKILAVTVWEYADGKPAPNPRRER